jgi:predicted membrane protein
VTSRLRDVVTVTIGAYLLSLGGVFLLDSSGAFEIDAVGLVGAAFGLALVALGVLSILAAIRVRRFARRLRRTIGHFRSAEEGWSLEDAAIQTVFGDILLDLRDATLPEGDTELTLLCWVGTIQVRAPRSLGLDIEAQTMVGSVDVLGRHEDGLVRDIHVRSDNFDGAKSRLHMRLSTFVGELLVVQVPDRQSG